ncbi:MAG: hypothetical protein V1944_01980, partial [Candidatus Aenigmatarchaeota archaeon]
MNWLTTAILAPIFFSLFGFFDKLSTFQSPILSVFIIYLLATVISFLLVVLKKKKIFFQKEAFLSGIFPGIAAILLLYALMSNFLIVVFPFVSFASVIFFLIILFKQRPKLSTYQKLLVGIGILMATGGLIISSASTTGGISSFMRNFASNPYFLFVGFLISVLYGLWSYYTHQAMKKK